MLVFLKILVLLSIQVVIIQCVVQKLFVRKVSSKIVERKRQDTIDTCRIFERETKRQSALRLQKSRPKRSVDENSIIPDGNPFLKPDDIKKIEKIVDKLYDDVDESERFPPRRIHMSRSTNFSAIITKNATNEMGFPQKALRGSANSSSKFMVTRWHRKWVHGIIPYYIHPACYDSHFTRIIMHAFDYFEKMTCIRLQRLRENPTDMPSMRHVSWLLITNPTRIRQCVHSNEKERYGGVQLIVLGYECMSRGEIIHELMHVLGFSHEHTRPDRDQHVSIHWENIKPGYKKNFELRKDKDLMNLPYDYESVLHYSARAFSKNGNVTIDAGLNVDKIGQRDGLSPIDKAKISFVYGNECMNRNKDYLVKTCPAVLQSQPKKPEKNISEEDIDQYFAPRIWPHGIVYYKIRDVMEFSVQEWEILKSVLQHIEKETCIEFHDITEPQDQVYIDKDHGSNNDDDDEDYDEDHYNNQTDHEDSQTNGTEKTFNNTVQVTGNELRNSKEDVTVSSSSKSPSLDKEDIIDSDKKGNLISINIAKDGHDGLSDNKDHGKIRRKRKITEKPETPVNERYSLVLARFPFPGCPCPKPGKPSGDKVLDIHADCFNSMNDLLHLFVHVLGLDHQHNAHDRDSHLHIVWDKLGPGIKKDLQKKLPPQATLGHPYDYQSVMHFSWLSIKNGYTNIMYPIWNDGWSMGNWQGLSPLDVQKINYIYRDQCAQRKQSIEETE